MAVLLHPSAVVFGIALVAYAVFSDNRCSHPSRKDTLQEQLDWLHTRPKVSHMQHAARPNLLPENSQVLHL